MAVSLPEFSPVLPPGWRHSLTRRFVFAQWQPFQFVVLKSLSARERAKYGLSKIDSPPTHVALSNTDSVASEPPPSLVDALEIDSNGVPPLNKGRRLRLSWDPDPQIWRRDARAAERLVHDLATRIGPVPIRGVEGTAAATVVTHERPSDLGCLQERRDTSGVAVEEPIEFYEGGIIASDAVRTGWNALRAVLRCWGVTEREGFSTWLRNNGFAATVPGNHIAAKAQEFIFSEAIAADARVALLEAVYVCYTVHVSRQLAVLLTIRESPRPRVVQRRTSPSSFPDGFWEQMDDLDLRDLVLMRTTIVALTFYERGCDRVSAQLWRRDIVPRSQAMSKRNRDFFF